MNVRAENDAAAFEQLVRRLVREGPPPAIEVQLHVTPPMRWLAACGEPAGIIRMRRAEFVELGLVGTVVTPPTAKKAPNRGFRSRPFSSKNRRWITLYTTRQRQLAEQLEVDFEVDYYLEHPCQIAFGPTRDWLFKPDFFAMRRRLPWFYIAVSERSLDDPNNRLRLEQAGAACASLGVSLELVSDSFLLNSTRGKNTAAIMRSRFSDQPDIDIIRAAVRSVESSSPTIEGLREILPDLGLDQVLWLVLHDVFRVDLDIPITTAPLSNGSLERLETA